MSLTNEEKIIEIIRRLRKHPEYFPFVEAELQEADMEEDEP